MTTILAMANWLKGHPWETVQYLLLIWGVANVVWAQWPKPKSERAETVWKWLHHLFQLVATTAEAKGTFTWPSLVRALLAAVLKVPTPDPFQPSQIPSKIESPGAQERSHD